MHPENLTRSSVVVATLLLSSFLITSCKEKTNYALVTNTAPITERENQELYSLFLLQMMAQEQMGNHSGEFKIQCPEFKDNIVITKTSQDGVPDIKVRREKQIMSAENYAMALRGYLELQRAMSQEEMKKAMNTSSKKDTK